MEIRLLIFSSEVTIQLFSKSDVIKAVAIENGIGENLLEEEIFILLGAVL